MASSKEYLTFVLQQLSLLEDVTYRPMMSEFIIYYQGKVIGGIYDDRFLVKITASSLALMPNAKREIPYPHGKEMLLVDEVDDPRFLFKLFEAMVDELPSPKKRKETIKVN